MKLLSRIFTAIFIPVLMFMYLSAPVIAAQETRNTRVKKIDYSHGFSDTQFEIKLKDNSGVSVDNNRLNGDEDKLNKISNIFGNKLKKSSKLFRTPKDKKENIAKKVAKKGKKAPSVDNYLSIELDSSVNKDEVVKQLEQLDFIESAQPKMLPAPTPSTTPDYSELQTYLSADKGLNAKFANQIDGGLGENVTIVDLEYDWNVNHEDLSTLDESDKMFVGDYVSPFNDPEHGTAVAGILVADHNGFGIDGFAPKANLKLVNTYSSTYGWDIANSIYSALEYLEPGDVMLIEQQAFGPTPAEYDYVPVEIMSSVYDAIVTATSMGVIVIEPAGNGTVNLDDQTYFGSSFPFGKPNSGAIMVGSSNACNLDNPNEKRYSSTYGSRVDVYADGACVTTTGYGYTQNLPNAKYTNSFSGTSSASAIVAGATALVSSAAQEVNKTLTPAQMKNALTSTGLVQSPGIYSGNIGKKPQIRQAIFSQNNVNITSCYTGGWSGTGFWLHIVKNYYKKPNLKSAQKHAVNLVGDAYAGLTDTSPSTMKSEGTSCQTSTYNAQEILKLESVARYTVLDLKEAQVYSAVLVGALLVFFGAV